MSPGQHAAPTAPAEPPARLTTLSIDCGGSRLKAQLFDADAQPLSDRVRVATPYPLTPEQFVAELVQLTSGLTGYDRLTAGVPGMIRHGRVVSTPHYPRLAGPFTPLDGVLAERWRGFDAQEALTQAYGCPTRVLNDAEVQGAGVVSGVGLELVLTLGTGLGCALFDDGVLAPHVELSQHPFRNGQTYDRQLGDRARKACGRRRWERRVQRAVEALRPVVWFDQLYLGGGNAKHLTEDLGPDVRIVSNSAGLAGGVRAWELNLTGSSSRRQGTA
jgi:polyphosphate glucokinase